MHERTFAGQRTANGIAVSCPRYRGDRIGEYASPYPITGKYKSALEPYRRAWRREWKKNMNYEALIEELKKWDEDEKFYREVWQRRKKGEPLDPLYKREDIDPEVREWALDPDYVWIRTRQRKRFLQMEGM